MTNKNPNSDNKMQRLSNFKDFVGELEVTYTRTELASEKVSQPDDAINFIRPYFDKCMDDHEEVKVLHLNKGNFIVNVHEVTSGSDSASLVPIKDILRNAILIKTSGIILVHNHPSGGLKPSKSDIQISKKLYDACKLLDLTLLDSLIITRESYHSLLDSCDL